MLANLHSEPRIKATQTQLDAVLEAHAGYVKKTGGMRAMLKLRDLSGLTLANRLLDEADFTGASLVGANASGSSFVRANLYCADLRFCNLRNANLQRADLRGATFGTADMAGAVLDYADMRAAIMLHTGNDGGLRKSRDDLKREGVLGGVDFRNASLRNVSLGNSKLIAPDFSGALLQGTRFVGATFIDAKFDGAVLTGVNLAELKVPPESLKACICDPTPEAIAKSAALRDALDAHERWVQTAGAHGKPAILDGADLRPLNGLFKQRTLVGLSARNAMAIGVDFSGSFLQGAKFGGADLRGARFAYCDISGASFRDAKLHHTSFDRAKLGKLQLASGAPFATSFAGAEVNSAQFAAALFDSPLTDFGLSPLIEQANA